MNLSGPQERLPLVTLRDYLLVIVRYGWLVAIVVVGAALIGWYRLETAPQLYSATATLLVRPVVDIGEPTWTAREFAATEPDARVTVHVVQPEPPEPPPLPVEVYAELLSGARMRQRVVDRLRLTRRGESLPRAARLLQAVQINAVPSTNLINVEARLADPQLVSAIANAVSQELVVLDGEMAQASTEGARDLIEARLEHAAARIGSLEEQVRRARSEDDQLRLNAARRIHEDLLVRAEAARLAASVPRSRLLIIQPATATSAPAMARRSPLIVAIVAGLCCSIALAFMLDYLRNPASPLRSRVDET